MEDMKAATAMPKYRCHKEVWALKITEVRIPDVPCAKPIGTTTCGYSVMNHTRYNGSPMDHEFTPPAGILEVSPVLAFDNDTFTPVTPHYIRKHKPEAGGYFIQYEDGYKSFSPAEPFESGYTRI